MSSTPFDTARGKPIVYVREADPEKLPEQLKNAAGKLYAVHDASGNPLALAETRASAFAVARHNDLEPLSVH
jgi:hypothetical protein